MSQTQNSVNSTLTRETHEGVLRAHRSNIIIQPLATLLHNERESVGGILLFLRSSVP